MVFPVVMYSCEICTVMKKEGLIIDAFELWCWRTLLRVLDSKEIKPVNPKGNQPWILVGRTNAEAEAPVFCSSDVNSRLIGKVPDAGKDWGQEKRASEDEMTGWHHWCNGHELGKTSGDGEGQGGLACCSPWGQKESNMDYWTTMACKNFLVLITFKWPFSFVWLCYTCHNYKLLPKKGHKILHLCFILRILL